MGTDAAVAAAPASAARYGELNRSTGGSSVALAMLRAVMLAGALVAAVAAPAHAWDMVAAMAGADSTATTAASGTTEPIQWELVYPTGKNVLHGDGITDPWQWVWIPAAAPPSPPPAP